MSNFQASKFASVKKMTNIRYATLEFLGGMSCLIYKKASLVLPNFMLFGESESIFGRVVQRFFKRCFWFIVSEPSEELSRGSSEDFSCSFCSGTKSALTCEENI